MDTRWILLVMPALLLVAPGEAGAKRKTPIEEVCGPPPAQAVPRETQREIEASVDARVKSLVGAGASTSFSDSTTFDTVLLTQDAAALDLLLYRLCLQRYEGILPADTYDREVARITSMTGQSATGVMPAQPEAPAAQPESPGDALIGTWNVVTHQEQDVCSLGRSGDLKYVWQIRKDASNAYVIDAHAISGTETSFPQMTGNFDGEDLLVRAHLQAAQLRLSDPVVLAPPVYLWAHVLIDVTVGADGTMRGSRLVSYSTEPQKDPQRDFATSHICAAYATVTATKVSSP